MEGGASLNVCVCDMSLHMRNAQNLFVPAANDYCKFV